MNIDWLEPWHPINGSTGGLEAELRQELASIHPLFGLPVAAIGRRSDCDDALFALLDGTNRVAVVHLTWRGRTEEDPIWPAAFIYESLPDWVERGMKADHEEYGAE